MTAGERPGAPVGNRPHRFRRTPSVELPGAGSVLRARDRLVVIGPASGIEEMSRATGLRALGSAS